MSLDYFLKKIAYGNDGHTIEERKHYADIIIERICKLSATSELSYIATILSRIRDREDNMMIDIVIYGDYLYEILQEDRYKYIYDWIMLDDKEVEIKLKQKE